MRFLEEKINKLYFTFLISALGSTLITTVYSTVDTIAIGQHSGPVGSAAIACVNPLWPCMLTLGILFGMGGSVMMNYRRGERREEEANEFFTVSLILSLIASVAICLVFTFFMEELLSFFGAKGAVLEAAKEYARPFAFGAPFFTLCSTASTFIHPMMQIDRQNSTAAASCLLRYCTEYPQNRNRHNGDRKIQT